MVLNLGVPVLRFDWRSVQYGTSLPRTVPRHEVLRRLSFGWSFDLAFRQELIERSNP